MSNACGLTYGKNVAPVVVGARVQRTPIFDRFARISDYFITLRLHLSKSTCSQT